MPEFPQDCILDFSREGCGFSRLSVPRMQRRVGFVLKPGFVGYFLGVNSIFHLFVTPRGYIFAICRHTESFLSAYPSNRWSYTAALNNRHSASASAVHSGSSRNKDDALSTKVSFTSLSARASYFIRCDLMVLHVCVGSGGFSNCKLQISRWNCPVPLPQPPCYGHAASVLVHISVLEEIAHNGQCVVKQSSVIIYVNTTMPAEYTPPHTAWHRSQRVHPNLPKRLGFVSLTFRRAAIISFTNSGYNALEFDPHTCIKYRQRP